VYSEATQLESSINHFHKSFKALPQVLYEKKSTRHATEILIKHEAATLTVSSLKLAFYLRSKIKRISKAK